MASEFAPITPAMLLWARETAGYSLDEVAKKIGGVKPATVAAWESGAKPITMGRVDALADIYRRPTVVFYLAKPPAEDDVRKVADFRAAPHAKSPPLLYQLRHARERHTAAVSLAQEAGLTPKPFEFSCAEADGAQLVGERLRGWLGVDQDEQTRWARDASGYTALNAWKDAIERQWVLIFQASKRDLGDCRGLSVFSDVFPVIVTRSVDVPTARCFTLMHELAHLGLRQAGVCDLHDGGLEAFCNAVAAAALMPAETLKVYASRRASSGWPDSELTGLARSYSVSEQALVLRLLGLGLVTKEFYNRKHAEFERRNAEARARKDGEEKSVAIPQHTIAIARNGKAFTRLVLEAYHRKAISGHRASRYLDVSFKFLGNIEREMARSWRAAS